MDLPLLNEEEEFDLLKEVLSEDTIMEEIDKEETKEEYKDNIMSSLLVALTDLHKLMIEQNQLLTSLNTGLRKNTIIADELVTCLRNAERRERDQSYRRRTNFGYRPNRASPRRPAVKSKVVKKD